MRQIGRGHKRRISRSTANLAFSILGDFLEGCIRGPYRGFSYQHLQRTG